MHSLDRVNMAWDRQHPCNIGAGVIGACPRFARLVNYFLRRGRVQAFFEISACPLS